MKILLAIAALLTSTTVGYSLQDPEGFPKPGPEHAELQKLVGAFDAVIIMAGMDGEEMRSKGKMTTTKHGDFHIIDAFEGEYMGMSFTGHGMTSYCPVRKKYMGMWTDSMTPSPMLLTGDYDKKTKQLTMTGESVGMSGKLEPNRTVVHFGDGNQYSFELFGPGPDGKEMRMVRIEYTRQK